MIDIDFAFEKNMSFVSATKKNFLKKKNFRTDHSMTNKLQNNFTNFISLHLPDLIQTDKVSNINRIQQVFKQLIQ